VYCSGCEHLIAKARASMFFADECVILICAIEIFAIAYSSAF
jgi:hypothetical protein